MVGASLDGLSKYVSDVDVPREKVEELCLAMTDNVPKDKDIVDVLNERFIEIDCKLADLGFARVALATEDNFDQTSSSTFDVVVNQDEVTSTVITFMILPNPDCDGGIEKKMISKRSSLKTLH